MKCGRAERRFVERDCFTSFGDPEFGLDARHAALDDSFRRHATLAGCLERAGRKCLLTGGSELPGRVRGRRPSRLQASRQVREVLLSVEWAHGPPPPGWRVAGPRLA